MEHSKLLKIVLISSVLLVITGLVVNAQQRKTSWIDDEDEDLLTKKYPDANIHPIKGGSGAYLIHDNSKIVVGVKVESAFAKPKFKELINVKNENKE